MELVVPLCVRYFLKNYEISILTFAANTIALGFAHASNALTPFKVVNYLDCLNDDVQYVLEMRKLPDI